MHRSPSISRFSLESADCSPPIVPPSSKPLGKLGKLLRLKTDASTTNGKYHTAQPNNTRPLAFDSSLASFRSRPKSRTINNPRPLSDAPRHRHLNHSISAPAMHASTLRLNRASSMKVHRSSVFDNSTATIPLSRKDIETRLYPIRRQPELSACDPQVISEKKSKWAWKGRMALISKRSRSPSPATKHGETRETPANLNITDVSTPPYLPPVAIEARILDICPLSGPSSSLDDLCLTPISTRSSILSEHERPTHKPQRSRGSINKVSRTLGVPEITFATEFGEVPLSASYDSYNPFDSVDLYPVRKQASVKLSRRLSITLSTFTTIPTLFRPSSLARRNSPASRSQNTLSTLEADDVHQFGLADDLSDSWGKISESRTSSSDLPISPITFHIPPEIPPSASSGNMKLAGQGEVSPPLPTLSCGRSQSLSSLQVRQVARTASRPDTPFDERTNTLAQASHPGSDSLHQVTEPRPVDAFQHSTSKTRTGQWNQDDIQDVIKKLRSLK